MKPLNKYTLYLLFVLIPLLIAIIIIVYYHLQNEIFYIFIYGITIDLSIILIPAVISLSRIFRSYQENKKDILNLYDKIIRIRSIISEKVKKNESVIAKDHYFLNPIIINDIKDKLRGFDLKFHSMRFDKIIDNKELYYMDRIIFDLLEIINSYEFGKRFKNLKKNGMVQLLLKRMENDLENPKIVRERLLNDLLWVITYHYFYESEEKKEILAYYENEGF